MSSLAAGRRLIAGQAEGLILRLDKPISFWGGVDPATGRIMDPRHPQCGAELTGTILVVPETVGSSSSSAIMLELLRVGRAPAGMILGATEAILVLGVVVAREMGFQSIPVVEVGTETARALPDTGRLRIGTDGTISQSGIGLR